MNILILYIDDLWSRQPKPLRAGFIVYNSESCFCAAVVVVESSVAGAERACSGSVQLEAGRRPGVRHRDTEGGRFGGVFAASMISLMPL